MGAKLVMDLRKMGYQLTLHNSSLECGHCDQEMDRLFVNFVDPSVDMSWSRLQRTFRLQTILEAVLSTLSNRIPAKFLSAKF